MLPHNKITSAALYLVDTSIANGAALSAAIDASALDFRIISVQFPAVWTAADLGIQVSRDGTTYVPLVHVDATTLTKVRTKITDITVNAASVRLFPAESWAVQNYPYFKLESLDTADETAENQGGARALVVGFLR